MTAMTDLERVTEIYLAASRNHIRALRATADDVVHLLAFRAVLVAEHAIVYTNARSEGPNVAARAAIVKQIDEIDDLLRDKVGAGRFLVVEDQHGDRHATSIEFDADTTIVDHLAEFIASTVNPDDGEHLLYGIVTATDAGAARLDRCWLPCVHIHTDTK